MFTIYKDIFISYFESIISSDPIFMAQTQFVVSEGHNIVEVIQYYELREHFNNISQILGLMSFSP